MREGWRASKLGDVTIKIGSGATPKGGKKAYKTKGIALIRSLNVHDGFFKEKNLARIDKSQAEKLANVTVENGDVLLNITGASITRCCVVPPSLLPARVNQHVSILRPNPNVLDSKFLEHLLISKQHKEALMRVGGKAGATRQALTKAQLENYIIEFPSLSEQKRIVAILDEAFAGIEKAVANTEKNLANARELFESYLAFVFNKKNDEWTETTLGAVCSFQGGSQPPKSEFSKIKRDGYIRLIQIRDYKSDDHIIFIPEEKAKRLCNSTDIMIGRYGPPLFQILRGIEGAYNVALMKAIPNEDLITKDFLYYFLQNSKIRNYVINASNRAAGQAGVNKATLEPYPFSYPDKNKQGEIVNSLQHLSQDIRNLEFTYQQKLTALAELRQSLLQKAFSGELTSSANNKRKEAAA